MTTDQILERLRVMESASRSPRPLCVHAALVALIRDIEPLSIGDIVRSKADRRHTGVIDRINHTNTDTRYRVRWHDTLFMTSGFTADELERTTFDNEG